MKHWRFEITPEQRKDASEMSILYRQKHCLSQKELASEVGCNTSDICKLEKNKNASSWLVCLALRGFASEPL